MQCCYLKNEFLLYYHPKPKAWNQGCHCVDLTLRLSISSVQDGAASSFGVTYSTSTAPQHFCTLPRLLHKKIIRFWVQHLEMRIILFTETPPPTSISLCDFLIRDRMHSCSCMRSRISDRYPVNAVSRQDFNFTLSLMKLQPSKFHSKFLF